MENHSLLVYVIINISLQEVYFGKTFALREIYDPFPEEISHWDQQNHQITNPMIVEEAADASAAKELLTDLIANAKRNPQGKTIIDTNLI